MSVIDRLRGYTGFFVGLLLVGIAIVCWGATAEEWNALSKILVSFGGALLGASLASLVGALGDVDFRSELLRLLRDSFSAGMVSKEDDINPYRRIFHFYHVTQIKEKTVWRYNLIDFSRQYTPGKLTTTVDELDTHGKATRYKLQAGVADERFIVFRKPVVGKESVEIQLYPFFGERFHAFHCGLSLKQSWDGTHLLTPCIMSPEPIECWQQEGTVEDEVASKLLSIWHVPFFRTTKIIPEDAFKPILGSSSSQDV